MIRRLLYILIILNLLSCGDAKNQAIQETVLEDQRLSVQCKLDSDKFTKIFEEDIEGDIRCLKDNLDLFLKIVKTDRPGFLSLQELKTFIQDRMRGFDPEVLKSIDAIFMLGHLVFGEENGYMSQASVGKLVELAVIVNKELLKIYPFFKNKQNIPYAIHSVQRQKVINSFKLMANYTNSMFVSKRSGIDSVDVDELVEKFHFTSNDKEILNLKTLLFLKRLLFGGEKSTITYRELETMVGKIDRLAMIFFDVFRLDKITFDKEQSRFDLLGTDLAILEKQLFFPKMANEDLFTLEDILKAFNAYKEQIMGADFTLDPIEYIDEITTVKEIFLGGRGSSITPENIYKFIDHFKYILNMGFFYNGMYDEYADILSRPQEVRGILEGYGVITLAEKNYKADFIRIINSYHFYKGSRPSPIFSPVFNRNASGTFEIGMIEYLAKQVFVAYGCPVSDKVTDCFRKIKLDSPVSSALGGYVMTKDSLITAINDVHNILLQEKLILPTTEISTAENIALLSSLFMFQANGNATMEINEVTEFVVSVLTAFKLGDDMLTDLKRVCPSKKYPDRVETGCMREHFMESLTHLKVDGVGYRKYFPRLFEYLDFAPGADVKRLFLEAEQAARACPREDVPSTKGDIMAIWTILIDAESTIMRYDFNLDNQLDNAELDRAFSTYHIAVDGVINQLAPGTPTLGGATSKGVYRYLIKNGKAPESLGDYLQVAGLAISCPDCRADRGVLASILKNLRQAFEKARNYEFNCKYAL